jgi:hypothetical protein
MATLATLRTEVLDHEFSPTRYSDFIDRQLNRCQTLIAQKVNFRELFDVEAYSTVNGTGSYALPTDYMRLESLIDSTNSDPLLQITTSDYDDLPASTSRGRPTNYVIDRTNIKLYPIPDAVYSLSLRFYRYPATMTASQNSEVPEVATGVLTRYALARCFERENDTNQATYHWGQYEKEMVYLMGSINDDANDVGQPQQVQGMWQPDSGITVVRP